MTDLREKFQKLKTDTERAVGVVKSAAQKGQTAWKITKAGVKTAVAGVVVGTGIHVYHQFHKTPDQIDKETIVMKTKTEQEVKKIVDQALGTNDTSVVKKGIKEGEGKIAGIGVEHGGAVRKWFSRKFNDK